MSEYSEDFEKNSVAYSEESFDAFESDNDNMLFLGNPIDHIIKLAEMGSDRFDGTSHDYEDESYEKFGNLGTIDEDGEYGRQAITSPTKSPGEKFSFDGDAYELSSQNVESPTSGGQEAFPPFSAEGEAVKKKKVHKKKPSQKPPSSSPAAESSETIKYQKVHVQKMDYDVPIKIIPSISSNIARETKYSTVVLQKQLAMAAKKIEAYSKERATLLRRLDSSAIEQEFEKFRGTISEQKDKIDNLMSENRSLRSVVSLQGRSLVSSSLSKPGEEEDIFSADVQVKILYERVRRLSAKLSEQQHKERLVTEESAKLKKKNAKLKSQNAKLYKFAKAASLEHTDMRVKLENAEMRMKELERLANMRSARLAKEHEENPTSDSPLTLAAAAAANTEGGSSQASLGSAAPPQGEGSDSKAAGQGQGQGHRISLLTGRSQGDTARTDPDHRLIDRTPHGLDMEASLLGIIADVREKKSKPRHTIHANTGHGHGLPHGLAHGLAHGPAHGAGQAVAAGNTPGHSTAGGAAAGGVGAIHASTMSPTRLRPGSSSVGGDGDGLLEESGGVDYPTLVYKLKKSLDLQRDSFLRQLATSRLDLKQAQDQYAKLKLEFEILDRQGRQQRLAMKQLREAYEELAEGQRRLHNASAVYVQKEAQPTHPLSAPPTPSIDSTFVEPAPPQSGRPSTVGAARRPRPPRGGIITDDSSAGQMQYLSQQQSPARTSSRALPLPAAFAGGVGGVRPSSTPNSPQRARVDARTSGGGGGGGGATSGSAAVAKAGSSSGGPTGARGDSGGSDEAKTAGSSRASSLFQVGMTVEGNQKGQGVWKQAVVEKVNGDGTYDLNYGDGEGSAAVTTKAELIRMIVAEGSSAAVGGAMGMTSMGADKGVNITGSYDSMDVHSVDGGNLTFLTSQTGMEF